MQGFKLNFATSKLWRYYKRKMLHKI